MQKKKSKKSAPSRSASTKSSSKSFGGFALAATANGQLDEFVAAKEALSASLLQVRGPEAFIAMSAATSPAPKDNLVGVGLGERVVSGKHTGAMAVKLLVRIKYSDDQLSATDRLPETINGVPTDVEEVGTFRRFAAPAPAPLAATPNPRTLLRPAPPGCSIGFRDPTNQFIMAGTFGALVKRGQKRFVLSNNHVLADENRLPLGSPVFQPGFLDAGNPPNNGQIAQLSAFTQLQVINPNVVDCAIAEVTDPSLVSNSILVIGPPVGSVAAQFDMVVHKFGRTTGYTAGRITSINTDVRIQYNLGTLFFKGQVIIKGLNSQPFSAAGDSGSLIVERSTHRAVGLLFAGSSTNTIANHIGDVFQALNVTLL
jgi:hypothetical protein